MIKKATTKPTTTSSNIERPQNEFSRTYKTSTLQGNRHDMLNLSATSEELQNLATRFSLPSISKLESTIELSRDVTRSDPRTNEEYIAVMGSVSATCYQVCVRTNQEFQVEMEFDVSVVVKATTQEERNEEYPSELAELEYAMNQNNNNHSNNNKKKRKNRKKRVQGGGSNNYDLSDVGMKEIESLLKDFNVNQDLDLFEDEAILGNDGVLDVGELISQMFRLKLDPYPKKPGSEPVSYSITG